jgi:hypothetical protein
MSKNVPGTPTSLAGAEIRCSDAEREQVRAALYAAAGEGRLTMAEVEDRLGRLEEARFRHELAAMTADLPAPEPPEATGWRPILAAARRTLLADLAVLFGRSAEPAPARRRVLLIVAAVIVLVLMAAIVLQGFEPHGFEGHGVGRG